MIGDGAANVIEGIITAGRAARRSRRVGSAKITPFNFSMRKDLSENDACRLTQGGGEPLRAAG
jgi:hypothetical protein